jgi:hypothetical protein
MVRKKLIEVALPLEAINKACAREKSIRHGHPEHPARRAFSSCPRPSLLYSAAFCPR